MPALDTNVLVRSLVNTDETLLDAARRQFPSVLQGDQPTRSFKASRFEVVRDVAWVTVNATDWSELH